MVNSVSVEFRAPAVGSSSASNQLGGFHVMNMWVLILALYRQYPRELVSSIPYLSMVRIMTVMYQFPIF